MPIALYHILHVAGALLLAGFTFAVFANPSPERRGRSMMTLGILGAIVLVAGFGLLAKLSLGFEIWVILKLVAWLGLSALSGLAFRKPELCGLWRLLAAGFLCLAVYAVYGLR
ncbi:MAG: hypothetical protein ABGY71_13745 [bacterium]|jgi:hypothetical protein|nr:hypothetical protein [Planctomycetota bacterium]HIL52559.1 hypothetical protein [Planctomycetota bacterium]